MWTFFDNHWFLAFLALCMAYGIVVRLLRLPVLLVRGWPPAHCDADGDLRQKDEEVSDECR